MAQRLFNSSLAPKTHRAYNLALQSLEKFRLSTSRPRTWPVPRSHVRAFLAFLASKQCSPSTASTYISAISFIHNSKSWPDPTKDFTTTKMLKGFKRLYSRPDSRAPITLDHLQLIIFNIPVVSNNPWETSLFKAAFLTCFFGLLRVSELSAPNKHSPSPLLVEHISFDVNLCLSLLITKSKTDQFKKGHLIKLHPTNHPVLCPCQALHNFLHEFRQHRPGPLFMHPDHSPLTSYQFSSVLRKSASAAGLPTQNISSHSMRIGACSLAAALGLQVKEIKRLGRWSSRAFTSYIRV